MLFTREIQVQRITDPILHLSLLMLSVSCLLGHHFQFTMLKKMKAPEFVLKPMRCKDAPSCPPSNTAHTEGWGLYSEMLGFNLKLFDWNARNQEDIYALAGYYSLQLMRTGKHIVLKFILTL